MPLISIHNLTGDGDINVTLTLTLPSPAAGVSGSLTVPVA